MPLPITAVYAALYAILVVVLAFRVVRLRRSLRVGLGGGGKVQLERAVRVHGNACEYLPLATLMLALAEGLSAPSWLLHLLGLTLLAGRIAHAQGLSSSSGISFGRTFGTASTWGFYIVAAIVLLVLALSRPGFPHL